MDRVILFVLIAFFNLSVPAADSAPPELAKWRSWVLEKHRDIDCPRLNSEAVSRRCAWPGTLSIEVSDSGLRFSQNWMVYGQSWIALPGNQQHWPLDVRVNDGAAAVLEQNQSPVLQLPAGEHRISGSLQWQERPQYLQIPADSALVQISIDGEALAWPNIDEQGRLWFKRPEAAAGEAEKGDSVKLEVFRRLQDGVPMTMESVLRLVVSGKPRELRLGRLLLADSEATAFHADLPARIDDDGSLRIQVRAGSWQVRLNSRFTRALTELHMQAEGEGWPPQEIWSFDAAPHIRGLKISGVDALDPGQLDLPPNWRQLPTYLLNKDSRFMLEEQYRGDVAPSANQLQATRRVWLDFDGSGATIKDQLNGVINQGWRLSAQPAMQLGRVAVGGEPQLVTRLAGDDSDGVEIRQQSLQLEAISRLKQRSALSASGWQHDLDSLNMILNLPPGWQLWHASGADSISHSWLSRWDLWDLFLCLLIVGATFKLLSLPWAALSTLTLALSYHESNAPIFIWVVLIVVLPLLQVLPAGGLRKTIAQIGYIALATLVMISLIFAVQQVRRGLYPQLEQQRAINAPQYSSRSVMAGDGAMVEEVMVTARKAEAELDDRMYDKDMSAQALSMKHTQAAQTRIMQRNVLEKHQRYQPSANTQTGPGEPTWQWHSVQLHWSGPVSADAPLQLYLSPPWFTRLLMFLQTALLALLVFGFGRLLLQVAKDQRHTKTPRAAAAPTAALVLLLGAVLGGLPEESQAEEAFPPQTLLQEWEQRLLQPPQCAPNCLAINAAAISVNADTLQMRLRVGSGADLGLPLPADKSWQITNILVNETPGEYLARNGGQLWLRLPAGEHMIHIEGRIRGDKLNIAFPLSPHNVSVDAAEWEVFGLVDKRVPGNSLQLQKREKAAREDTLLADAIAPFVKVKRHLDLDLDWRLRTSVSRIAPKQGGLSVNIPLLAGESVVTEGLKVIEENGQRYISATFGARQRTVSWTSVIKPVDRLHFTAASDAQFVESWSAQSSPRWHISYSGLTAVKSNNQQQGAIPQWLPWPGESLDIQISKPEAVAGATTTVESVIINSKPGTRSTELELQLRIRTSLGGDFRIQSPANATLESIAIDGVEKPKQQEDANVVLPLHPGLQSATVNWLIKSGVDLKTSTPAIGLSAPAGNIELHMSLPQSRWPLLVSGPDIGPAMLYWGVLIVILCVAVALGRIIRQQQLDIPVNTWQWVLLALGMSTVNMIGSLPVVLWFFAMAARARLPLPTTRWQFNLVQVAMVALTVVALVSLFATIPQSLLATPDMQVTGNGSYNYSYNWYQDYSTEQLPQAHVFSVPIWVYRVVMLSWSLWLVFALLRWARWSWTCFSKDRLWMGRAPKIKV